MTRRKQPAFLFLWLQRSTPLFLNESGRNGSHAGGSFVICCYFYGKLCGEMARYGLNRRIYLYLLAVLFKGAPVF